MTIYTFGNGVNVEASFYDEAGVLSDPAGVTFAALAPDGTKTTYVYGTDEEVSKEEAGVYRLAITLDQPGTWRFRAVGSGTLVIAIESQPIPVAGSPFYEEA